MHSMNFIGILFLSSVVVCRCVWKIMLTYQVVFI